MLKQFTRIALLVLAAAPAAAETPLTVMTFNVRYGTANDGENSWTSRRDTVVAAIASQHPDIVGMQECLKFQADYIAGNLPEYSNFGVGREADGSGERMEIFYRFETIAPVQTGHFWLSETPERPGSHSWNSANVRMASWARFHCLKTGDSFFYLNTHLDHRSEAAREGAARMLADWVRDLPNGAPVVVTGDFNAAAEQSLPWQILTAPLRDAWLVAKQRTGPPLTWSGFKAPTDEVRRIDWLLVSDSIVVNDCTTVTYNDGGRYPSDHFPVVATLVLP